MGAARAKAISYLGNLVFDQGDFAHAIALQEASSVPCRRELRRSRRHRYYAQHLANA